MKLEFILFSLLIGTGAHAANNGFAGTWSGPGIWSEGLKNTEIATATQLTVSESDSSFRFEECWDYKDRADGSPKHSCIESTYSRDPSDSLWINGKKVGDIFSDHVQIYVGNSQVGEQIVMELGGDPGELRYRYNYLNFDGAAESREANLKPVP